MTKKILLAIAALTLALACTACAGIPLDIVNTSRDTHTADVSIIDTSANTIECTAENIVKNSGTTELISDEDAIELFKSGMRTVSGWLYETVDGDYSSEDIIYRDYGHLKNEAYYPISKETYLTLPCPDIVGNTKIYYGDYDWTQENLQKIFSKRFITEYFTYEYPHQFIYENGIVYTIYSGALGSEPQASDNYTVIHKTENEFAVICEIYGYDWDIYEYDYSHIKSLEYIKFIRIDDAWLIDECYYTGQAPYVRPKDLIPREYIDGVPAKYHEMTEYFEK